MPFDEASHPANPQNAANTQENFFWPDRSWFCYDLPPRNICDDWNSVQVNDIYDLPQMPINTFSGRFSGWSMWMDKIQKDYRFGAFSDTNAEANIFPEVHDPWMFTEYVTHGVGKEDDQDDSPSKDKGIIEPPLLNPVSFTRDVVTAGESRFVDSTDLHFLNDQRVTFMRREHQPVHDLEYKWKSSPDPVSNVEREYWESELDRMEWRDKNSDGSENVEFHRMNVQRRVVRYAHESINSGVRIYRHPVWSWSTRWGHSQNIPDRTLNLTAPKSWMKPSAIFTGRIVPQVTVEWGIPIYDNIPNPAQGGQYAIKYDNYGATATSKISLFNRNGQITGVDGVPDSQFSYPKVPTSGTDGSLQVPMPRDNLVTLIWNSPKYVNNDLVHHGCQFWKGELLPTAGNPNPSTCTARCTYYEQNQSKFGVIEQVETNLTSSPAPLGTIVTQPYNINEYGVEVVFESGTTKVNVESVGKKLSAVIGAAGLVTGIRVLQANGQPAVPFASNLAEGFTLNPGTTAKITLKRYARNKPWPHKTMCGMYNGSDADAAKDAYRAAGGKCSYYTPVGKRVLASYKAQSHNGAEWANMQRGMPSGTRKSPLETAAGEAAMGMASAGGGLGVGVVGGIAFAFAGANMVPSPWPDEDISDDYQRISIEFVPETVEISGKARYYNTPSGQPPTRDPESKLRIKAGTGFHLMDDKDTEPYSGVDTPFFGFVNQINYRIGRNVQHCYKPESCDSIITSPSGAPGWRRGRYSNINFTNHPLRMSGFPGLDGTDRYCHTGDRRCPFNHLDRRAVEFDKNYQILLEEILRPFRMGGIDSFTQHGLREAYLLPTGKIQFSPPGSELEEDSEVKDCLCVAVCPSNITAPVLGHYYAHTEDNDSPGSEYRIYFYYDRSSGDPEHRASHVFAHIIQFDDDNNAVYMKPPTDPNQVVAWLRLFGDENFAPWLVELHDDYKEPTGYAVEVTNQLPFIGGRAPEYKDHSRMGSMIMSPWGGITNNTYVAGANGNQFGGKAARPTIEGQQRRSYWTDSDGEWILDGRKIGFMQGFVDPRSRMRNKPSVYGDKHPIDGIPGNKIEDPNKPGGSIGNSDWASTGYTYSNDTKSFLEWLADVWQDYLPDDPNAEEPGTKISIGPPSANTDFLPRERKWFQCNHCGTDFPHEEVKRLKTLQVRAGDYPTPAHQVVPLASGINVNTMVPLYPNPSGQTGEMGCPRFDGGSLIFKGGYDRFMRCYSRGSADVWGPPGSTVDHHGYFWKNPTLINRIHQDHASNKLGKYNPGQAGGYSFSTLNTTVERMGRLPLTTAKNYQIGLSHQITAPWAAPGETIQSVRDRIADVFQLRQGDNLFLQEADGSELTVVSNMSQQLRLNQIIHVWRFNSFANVWDRIGLPIICCSTLPAVIQSEQIIINDPARPIIDDFNDDYGNPDEDAFNRALKQWMMNVVTGSLQHYSSHVYMRANALADALTARGLNPNPAFPVNPVTGQHVPLDERILDPYGTAPEGGGLKMASLGMFKRFRNRILPMFAYDCTASHYTAGGDYYNRVQAGYRNRFATKEKPLPITRYTRIAPQVMAATEKGIDYYVEWEIGDWTNEKARAYYPVGSTWWRIEQRVGHIRRKGGTNWFHLDDSTNSNFRFPYTGDNIVSTATYFLHGTVPMDKEVERALLIVTPDDAPSMDAIGCQGQYSGFTSTVGLDGNTYGSSYEGHSFCFWQHYHGYTTNHERAIPPNYYGWDARMHVIAGHVEGCVTLTDHEETFTICDYFKNRGLLDDAGNPSPFTDFDESQVSVVPQALDGNMDYLPNVTGGTNAQYTTKTELLGLHYEDTSHGFDLTQSYLSAWDFGQPLSQVVTEHEIWKDWTYEQYEKYRQRYHVDAIAQVNTFESTLTFEYYGSTFRGTHFPRQNQGIPGWFNFDGYDSSGRFPSTVDVEAKENDPLWANGTQVLVQADGSVTLTASNNRIKGGGNGPQQAGNVAKVLDVTATIKKLYNERVDRYYRVKLGAAYEDLFALVRDRTDTNLGKVSRFHQGVYDPMYFWNYRYMGQFGSFKAGMWLNDPWHHPALSADRPITAAGNGDPISQSAEDRRARIAEVSDWDDQGLNENDVNYKQFHPFSLLSFGNPSTFTESTPSEPVAPTPSPLQDESKYWRVIDDQAYAHYFTTDLRQTPYEHERKPWRFEPGGVDSTSALCPNLDCIVHQNGWTVGQFYAQATTTWGLGVIPSTTSEYCAMCHSKLVGVRQVGGDGITTVAYDTAELDDVIVNGFEISTEHSSWLPNLKHGFVVEFYNSKVGQWRTLLNVIWDQTTNRYLYPQWDGSQWATISSISLPTIFKGCEGINGEPKKRFDSIGCHFTITTAVKVRFRVPKPAINNRSYPLANNTWATAVPNQDGGYVEVPPDTTTVDTAVGKKIILRDPNSPSTERTLHIVSAQLTGQNLRLNLRGEFSNTNTQFRVVWKEYISKCTKFRVYGFPYRDGDVVITDPGFVQPMFLSTGNNKFRLNNWPSQITQVLCQVGDGVTVPMAEFENSPTINGEDSPSFFWTVARDTFDGVEYLRITAGKWYYDFEKNQIQLPTYFFHPVTQEKISIWEINSSLYTDTEKTFTLKTLPSYMMVEYLTGIGMPVEVKIESVGTGPSYQLEPECVQFVCSPTGNGSVGGYQIPEGETTTTLPSIGASVRLKNLGGQRINMLWHCYNNEPIIWNGDMAWLVGDELMNTGQGGAWGDDDIANFFTGKLGRNLSELGLKSGQKIKGESSPIRGASNGKVTLYGASSTILSGQLLVLARAYTKRTYNIPNGSGIQTVTMEERTGGMRCGFFTFRLLVNNSVTNGRTGITASVPRLLVYMRERGITESV